MEEFWKREAAAYAGLEDESNRVCLHPWLRALASGLGARSVLDYGCGDAALWSLPGERPERLVLFDPSEVMLGLARERLGEQPGIEYHRSAAELPEGACDLAICCLVLMTLSSEAALVEAVQAMRRTLAPGGTCVIAVTHPCFRQFPYSTFRTEYVDGAPFDYFQEGAPFRVRLEDGTTHETVEFTDYHWSLSFLTNLLLRDGGLRLERLVEVPDAAAEGKPANRVVPPYLVYVLRC